MNQLERRIRSLEAAGDRHRSGSFVMSLRRGESVEAAIGHHRGEGVELASHVAVMPEVLTVDEWQRRYSSK